MSGWLTRAPATYEQYLVAGRLQHTSHCTVCALPSDQAKAVPSHVASTLSRLTPLPWLPCARCPRGYHPSCLVLHVLPLLPHTFPRSAAELDTWACPACALRSTLASIPAPRTGPSGLVTATAALLAEAPGSSLDVAVRLGERFPVYLAREENKHYPSLASLTASVAEVLVSAVIADRRLFHKIVAGENVGVPEYRLAGHLELFPLPPLPGAGLQHPAGGGSAAGYPLFSPEIGTAVFGDPISPMSAAKAGNSHSVLASPVPPTSPEVGRRTSGSHKGKRGKKSSSGSGKKSTKGKGKSGRKKKDHHHEEGGDFDGAPAGLSVGPLKVVLEADAIGKAVKKGLQKGAAALRTLDPTHISAKVAGAIAVVLNPDPIKRKRGRPSKAQKAAEAKARWVAATAIVAVLRQHGIGVRGSLLEHLEGITLTTAVDEYPEVLLDAAMVANEEAATYNQFSDTPLPSSLSSSLGLTKATGAPPSSSVYGGGHGPEDDGYGGTTHHALESVPDPTGLESARIPGHMHTVLPTASRTLLADLRAGALSLPREEDVVATTDSTHPTQVSIFRPMYLLPSRYPPAMVTGSTFALKRKRSGIDTKLQAMLDPDDPPPSSSTSTSTAPSTFSTSTSASTSSSALPPHKRHKRLDKAPTNPSSRASILKQ